jgi:HEAT repeat protein
VRLLQRLGEQAGFEVVAAKIEPKEISTDLVAVRLADAVGALLSDVPHALGYQPDPEAGAPRLTLVRVGGGEHLSRRAERRREARSRFREQRGAGKPDAELTPEQRERREQLALLRERRRESAEGRAERRKVRRPDPPEEPENPEELLEDRDPEVRSRAVGRIQPDGEGSVRLQTILAEDLDPGVRAAAAYRLVGADSIDASRSLIAALADPEPEVVLAVIDTLEYSQDPSLIPDLEPLLGHPDREVREAAADAIDFLR